ncbi:MAG: helix-turn-helix transcriptional regulator [Deltaproteobacteria bacterium]|jgi:DNA-binding CsgD family transcriptional regulator|nr:helix-turn-helix transcriptional regulator [Deltaproteobacteria bacterium]
MRRDSFLLPALSMGLIYGSISFGMIVLNLRDSGKFDGNLAALVHFILALAGGLGLYYAQKAWRNSSARLPFAVLAALIGLFCAVVPALPGEWPALIMNGRLPIISTSAGLFMALGLALFFRAAPAGREGLFYGLIMALGELLWVVLFPLLPGGVDADPASGSRTFFHLSAFCCLAMGSAGLCLSAAFSLHGAPDVTRNVSPAGDNHSSISPGTRSALLWMFTAGIGMFTLIGLEMGMRLPKAALAPGFVNLPHFIPLLFLPLAGKTLDGENPGRLMILLIPLCLIAPFLGLAQARGLLDPLSLFCLLIVIRQILLLAVFTVCARLMKTHALLPLLLSLAYCLHLMQFVGAMTRNLPAAFPSGVFTAALALAAGTAFCLWRFRRLLKEKLELWELPEKEDAASEPDMEKFHAFAVIHDLTGREQEILFGLIRGASLEDLGREFGVELSTVRYHQTHILKKTGMASRSNLLRHFIFWQSKQP